MTAANLRGMKRSDIQAQSLLRRQSLLAYIERQGPADTNAIITALGYPRDVIFGWLRTMAEDGHVILTQVAIGHGHKNNVYSIGPNRAPLAKFKLGGGYQPIKDPKVKQRCVKAKQIGMPRDPLVAALFGQVTA